jgi:hypothetical protein
MAVVRTEDFGIERFMPGPERFVGAGFSLGSIIAAPSAAGTPRSECGGVHCRS